MDTGRSTRTVESILEKCLTTKHTIFRYLYSVQIHKIYLAEIDMFRYVYSSEKNRISNECMSKSTCS